MTHYECHITVEITKDKAIRTAWEVLADRCGWKTSCIDGDPLLGAKSHFYFTRHSKNFMYLFDQMNEFSEMINAKIIRKKIELIVYDTKTGIGV